MHTLLGLKIEIHWDQALALMHCFPSPGTWWLMSWGRPALILQSAHYRKAQIYDSIYYPLIPLPQHSCVCCLSHTLSLQPDTFLSFTGDKQEMWPPPLPHTHYISPYPLASCRPSLVNEITQHSVMLLSWGNGRVMSTNWPGQIRKLWVEMREWTLMRGSEVLENRASY